jgi:hypothetical protein
MNCEVMQVKLAGAHADKYVKLLEKEMLLY